MYIGKLTSVSREGWGRVEAGRIGCRDAARFAAFGWYQKDSELPMRVAGSRQPFSVRRPGDGSLAWKIANLLLRSAERRNTIDSFRQVDFNTIEGDPIANWRPSREAIRSRIGGKPQRF